MDTIDEASSMDETKFDFAVSIGEGTLLAYGSTDLMDAPPLSYELLERYRESFTIILGPAIGTGE